MSIDWLLDRMAQCSNSTAIVWHGQEHTYGDLLGCVRRWNTDLDLAGVQTSHVVFLESDYSPNAVALLIALVARAAIVVPLVPEVAVHRPEYLEIAQAQILIRLDDTDNWNIVHRDVSVDAMLLRQLVDERAPGLVIFSSGSTGRSKASVHRFLPLLEKFKVARNRYRTLTFLLLDHIGGINTLFQTLANGGAVVVAPSRDPAIVCQTIERHRVELLPVSPTFLNLILISQAYLYYDLSSLRVISYGTEVMPQATLCRLREVFPQVRLVQLFGMSEIGIMPSKTHPSDQSWINIGGKGCEIKIVDGVLWIRSQTTMLGYLNAPNPIDEDGWINTHDVVEIDGEYMRILGRSTDIINVGGQKVFPAEVESVLLLMENIRDVTVYGEKNVITGQIVVARISLASPEDHGVLKKRIRAFCRDRLASYKIPAKVEVTEVDLFNARFKKRRSLC